MIKCWERILFRIICLFNTRPRRGQTEAERYGIRRKRVPALLRPNFIFMVFVSDTIVATSISQPLFRKQIGHSVTAVLEEIAISNFDVSYPIQEETVLSERIRLSGNGKRNMHRRFFIYYRSFSAVSGGVIKIIKFSFPAKSCISSYPG